MPQIILIVLLLIISWLLLAPLELEIDTRVPIIVFRWKSIGTVNMVYEQEEWLINLHLWFFNRSWNLERLIFAKGRPKNKKKVEKQGTKRFKQKNIQRLWQILKSFNVKEWKLGIDSGDYLRNAWLYPANFTPYAWQHLFVNFTDDNFLVLKISNTPWRLLYSLIK